MRDIPHSGTPEVDAKFGFPKGGLSLTACPVCGTQNPDLQLRCVSCKSFLQSNLKALDLFSTVYNLWKYPAATLKKIILAEHRNYTLLLALLESFCIGFFFLYLVKGGDIYSIDLSRLIIAGLMISVVVFLPGIYFFSVLAYFISRLKRTGARFRGIVSGTIFALHPLVVDSVILIPVQIAVFGPFYFSNNPAPTVINAVPFYFLSFLEVLTLIAVVAYFVRLSRLLFGTSRQLFIFAGAAGAVLYVAFGAAKEFLLK